MKKLLCMMASAGMLVSLTACGGTGSGTASGTAPAGSAAAAASATPVTGGTYIYAMNGEPATLNPDTISDDYNYEISQNIYNRLYKLTNDYTAVPDLASSYDVSDDGLTYTFHLREGVKWSDGEPFSSADVIYTYQTIVDKQYANASVFENVDTMTAPDDNTVVFNMKQPDGSFVSNLAWYGTFVLPQHLLDGKDWLTDGFNDAPVGTGPFKFDQWNKGTDVQIVRNDSFFGDKPYLDRVIYTIIPDNNTAYQAWLNNEVDEVGSTTIPTSDLQNLIDQTDKYRTMTQVWPSPWYLTFNLEKGPFADVKVRQAVAMGVNREDVSTKATSGFKPSNNYYIPESYKEYLNEDAKEPDYDTEGAMKLLEEAGYTKNSDGYYFETTMEVMSGGFEDAAKVVADNLDKIGIKVNLNIVDYNIWTSDCLDDYNFEITMLAGFEGPDVLGTGRRWTTTGAINVARYSNADVDALFNDAVATTDKAQLTKDMKEIQTHLAQDIPMVMLLQYTDVQPYKLSIHGHPYFSEADGGSKEKSGFSELTYVWLDSAE